ncbi:MAG: peptide chain release factor-like protein [Simkania negevensis]|nr:peptide chain release factor-like protein [Simkania negevensis]
MVVGKEKIEELKKEMERLKIEEKDLMEKPILGSGKGGQKLQKTHSTISLKHLPTNIVIKCGKTRSLETNRFLARRQLCEEIAKTIFHEKTEKELEREKIRKQKKRRERRFKD